MIYLHIQMGRGWPRWLESSPHKRKSGCSNPIHHVMSLSVYSKSVRLEGFKSVNNDYLNGDVTPRIFFKFFRIKIRGQASTFFSSRYFLYYIYIHMVHERGKCTPLRSDISRALDVGADRVKSLWECELMKGTLPWVLFYIPLMWNVCAMLCKFCYMKVQTIQKMYHVIFVRKYKTLQNINIPVARFKSSGTPFFCSPSSVIVVPLYVGKIPKWDETTKQTIKNKLSSVV